MALRLGIYFTDYDENISSSILTPPPDFVTIKNILHKIEDTNIVHNLMIQQNFILKDCEDVFLSQDIICCRTTVLYPFIPNYTLVSPKNILSYLEIKNIYKTLSEINFKSNIVNGYNTFQTEINICFLNRNCEQEISFNHVIKLGGT